MPLNVYGKVAVVSAALGLGLLLVFGGPPYPGEAFVLFGISVLAVAVAMYRNSPEDEQDEYPHDRDAGDDESERERTREKDLEYKDKRPGNWL